MADWDQPQRTLNVFKNRFQILGYDVEAVERATVEQQSQFSPHSLKSMDFMHTVIGASSACVDILRHGLQPKFRTAPGPYREPNNKSATENMSFVRKKVAEWEKDGFVTRLTNPAYCTSPLPVAQKFDPV